MMDLLSTKLILDRQIERFYRETTPNPRRRPGLWLALLQLIRG